MYTSTAESDAKARLLDIFQSDRVLAHELLFEHRRTDASPLFHKEFINLYSSPLQFVLLMAFRGSAKSSIMEEFVILEALMGGVKNALILGNSYPRACERLASVKHEIEGNEFLAELFGPQVGTVWNENKVVLKNGVCLQALGAGQSMRGVRHLQWRPDLVLGDDLEDEENAATEEARLKMLRWLMAVVLPAIEPKGRVRINGTPLDVRSLLEKLRVQPGWNSRVFPAVLPASLNPDEWEEATWPDRFPLTALRETYRTYVENGMTNLFAQEYLCRAEDPASKLFQAKHVKIAPAPAPTWAPVMFFVDPARTVKAATSARTGYAAWSWVGRKLHVHAAFGAFHKPDQILDQIFTWAERFHPVFIGVEPDGLEEFIAQPLRTEQVRRGIPLPILTSKAVRAPRDKGAFISSLQPFFEAGMVEMTDQCSDLIAELLAFPTGRKDVLNALAYSLRMRPGRPIYEDFSERCVAPVPLLPDPRQEAHLALNATPGMLTGVLMQRSRGQLRVLADWLYDGPMQDGLDFIVPAAAMIAGRKVRLCAPPDKFERYDVSGLIAAARRQGLTISKGRDPRVDILTPWLRRTYHGEPALVVDPGAWLTLNGLSSGYTRFMDDAGRVSDRPEQNQYCTLVQGMEALVAQFEARSQLDDQDNEDLNWQWTADGRRYISALAGKRDD